MVIDFHTHAFPEKVAERALSRMIRMTGGCIPHRDGTLASLERQSAEDGVRSVLLAIATNARQMHAVNDWAAEALHSKEIAAAFGSVHPDAPDALEELDRIAAMGMKGVKLHPEYQGVQPDDPRMLPIYHRISKLGLITVFHSGKDPAYLPPCRLDADMWRRILPHLDGAPVVAAHFGGYMIWEDMLRLDVPENFYVDTAYSFEHILFPLAERMVEKLGADHVLFGSDSPWDRPARAMRLIENLPLSDTERQQIFCDNAARLLRLDVQ